MNTTFQIESINKRRCNCELSIELPDPDNYTEADGIEAIKQSVDYLKGRAVATWKAQVGSYDIMEWKDIQEHGNRS